MKNILLVLIVFISISLKAQIPQFEHNATKKDSIHSIILKYDIGNYNLLITYFEKNAWDYINKKSYIIANKNTKWYLITIIEEYNKYELDKIEMNSSTIVRIPKRKVHKIFNTFSKNNFWNLNSDSLNYNPNKIIKTDCSTYRFEIITTNKYRALNAYYPQGFLNSYPNNNSRFNFINCQNAFEKIINKYK